MSPWHSMSPWLRTVLFTGFVVGIAIACGPIFLGKEKPTEVNMSKDKAQTNTAPDRQMPPLSADERHIIVDKGTERPFTGKYWNTFAQGVYLCRQCGSPLYLSDSKFKSDCGWPSFDDEIPGAVRRQTDADGMRTEIMCANCGAHLGHVFVGEGLTPRDTRHCVNSASLSFVSSDNWALERAIFAGGCFWGVEHAFRGLPGVISIRSGFTGGTTERPTYKQVCTGKTGHAEAVEILFDPAKVSYEKLARLYFEIHDPTTRDRQGPDVGSQYRSAVFYTTDEQKKTATKLIELLKARGYNVVTQLEPAKTFWPAEEYHQDYFGKHAGMTDCHIRVERFGSAKELVDPLK